MVHTHHLSAVFAAAAIGGAALTVLAVGIDSMLVGMAADIARHHGQHVVGLAHSWFNYVANLPSITADLATHFGHLSPEHEIYGAKVLATMVGIPTTALGTAALKYAKRHPTNLF